jgi:hypothetical protein
MNVLGFGQQFGGDSPGAGIAGPQGTDQFPTGSSLSLPVPALAATIKMDRIEYGRGGGLAFARIRGLHRFRRHTDPLWRSIDVQFAPRIYCAWYAASDRLG